MKITAALLLSLALLPGCKPEEDPAPPANTLPPVGPLNGFMVTSNQGDGTFSVLDAASGKLMGTVLAPIIDGSQMEMLHELSADPRGQFVVAGLMEMPASLKGTGDMGTLMSSTLPGYLIKLSRDNGTLLGKVQVDRDPGDNAVSLDGKYAFVTHYDLGKIARAASSGLGVREMDANLVTVDLESMTVVARTPVCAAPHIIQLSADGKTLYTTCIADEIAVVDISDPLHPVVERVQESPGEEQPTSAINSPYALRVSPLDGSVWVSNMGSHSVKIMDAVTHTFVSTLLLSARATPYFMGFSPDGTHAYLAHQSPDGISVFDGVTRTALAEHVLPASDCISPHQIAVSGDGAFARILCEGDHVGGGTYVVVKLADWSVVSSTRIGIEPVEMEQVPAAR